MTTIPNKSGRKEGSSYQGFRFLDVFLSEKELSIEVREVDGIEIDDVDFREASEDEVLEQLAPDAPSADEQNSSLQTPPCQLCF